MPAVSGNNDLFKSLEKDQTAVKAFNAAKSKEVRHDTGGDLPPGINDGQARLSEIKLDTHKEGPNKGKTFFYLGGVVLLPAEHQGSRVNFIVGLYDGQPGPKQKTKADRIDEMLNYVKLLGVETSGLKSLTELNGIFTALKKSGPIFGFRTWAGKPSKEYPNPRTNTVLKGLVGGDSALPDPGANDAVEDNTAVEEDRSSDATDWLVLGETADAGGKGAKDAQDKITAACLELGMSKKDIADVPSWTEAAQLIIDGGSASEEGVSSEETFQPNVDDVVHYKPKGAKSAVECVVTHVFKTTLNLKNVETDQIYKGIAYTESPPTLGGNPVID